MEHPRKVLSIQWTRFIGDKMPHDCFLTNTTIFWRNHTIEIKIHCRWDRAPIGYRTFFDFNVDGNIQSYKLLDSYFKATNGSIPKIEFEGYHLDIKALPTSLEISEMNFT